MSILINNDSQLIIQGITGKTGKVYASRMERGYTKLIGGVTPGKGGEKVNGVPVYNTVRECMKYQKPNVSLVVVPPTKVIDAVLESVDEGIRIIVIYTDDVPIHDTIKYLNYAANNNVIVVGPGAAGIVSPNQCNVSEIYDSLVKPGKVGIVAKSGSLCNEVLNFMNKNNIGQSTVCCLGGGFLIGLKMKEVIERFSEDPDTSIIVLLGEVGGTDELDALETIKYCKKPIVSYIAGFFAPPGVRMGHAGAILGENKDSAAYKSKMLESCGVVTKRSIKGLFNFIIKETKKDMKI